MYGGYSRAHRSFLGDQFHSDTVAGSGSGCRSQIGVRRAWSSNVVTVRCSTTGDDPHGWDADEHSPDHRGHGLPRTSILNLFLALPSPHAFQPRRPPSPLHPPARLRLRAAGCVLRHHLHTGPRHSPRTPRRSRNDRALVERAAAQIPEPRNRRFRRYAQPYPWHPDVRRGGSTWPPCRGAMLSAGSRR